MWICHFLRATKNTAKYNTLLMRKSSQMLLEMWHQCEHENNMNSLNAFRWLWAMSYTFGGFTHPQPHTHNKILEQLTYPSKVVQILAQLKSDVHDNANCTKTVRITTDQ